MNKQRENSFGQGLHLPTWACAGGSADGNISGNGMTELTQNSGRGRRVIGSRDSRVSSSEDKGKTVSEKKGDRGEQVFASAKQKAEGLCASVKKTAAALYGRGKQLARKAASLAVGKADQAVDAAEAQKTAVLQRNILLAGILFLGILGSVAAAQFYRQAQFYQTHFRPGTSVNGIDASNKTVNEIESLLAQRALDYSLTLRFRGGRTETLSREDFGYEYISDGSTAELLDQQDAFRWFQRSKDMDVIDVRLETSYDPALLKTVIAGLPELQEESMEAPADAARSWDPETHSFQITPESEGSLLDADTVFSAACEAVETGKKELDLEKVDGAYAAPAVRADDKELVRETEQLNELAGISVTLQTPEGDVVLDGETLQTWLTKDEDGGYKKDTYTWNTKTAQFVNELADSIDSVGKERDFTMNTGETTVIDGSEYYGWEVDRTAELEQLKKDLSGNSVTLREPRYIRREAAPMADHDGVGDTYVEADLSRQHIWMYKDGKQILDSDVVSGTMTESRHTPEGIFLPLSLQRNAVLRGSNGGESWTAPVSCWMKLTEDGVGLHDAGWRYEFGGDIYIYGGSHGCINLPPDVAEEIFENLTPDTPVVVYYSEPYTLS